MPISLYDLPNWLFGILICGGWVVIGLAGYVVFQRVCRAQFAEGERNLAIALLAVIATVNSLLLAFSAVSVWESHPGEGPARSTRHTGAGRYPCLHRSVRLWCASAGIVGLALLSCDPQLAHVRQGNAPLAALLLATVATGMYYSLRPRVAPP